MERLILREEAYSRKFEQCDSACSCVSTYSGEILEPLPLPPRESPAAPYLRHLSFLVNLRNQESPLLKLLVWQSKVFLSLKPKSRGFMTLQQKTERELCWISAFSRAVEGGLVSIFVWFLFVQFVFFSSKETLGKRVYST